MSEIKPILAAFSFGTLADARAAFARLDGVMNDIGAWVLVNPEDTTPLVAILGEREKNVDDAAAVVMASPGFKTNYLLTDAIARILMIRRYSQMREAFAQGENLHVNHSWAGQGGAFMDRQGREVPREA